MSEESMVVVRLETAEEKEEDASPEEIEEGERVLLLSLVKINSEACHPKTKKEKQRGTAARRILADCTLTSNHVSDLKSLPPTSRSGTGDIQMDRSPTIDKENVDQAGDHLGVFSKTYLMKILRKQGDQHVLFADKVLKYTGKGKVKRRILIISEFALYIIVPETNALKRRVSLAAVERIFLSKLHDHFIAIHIPTEYDILLASPRKNEIAAKLVEATRSSPDDELQVIHSNRFEYNASAELVKEVHNEFVEGCVRTRFAMAEAT